MGEAKRKLASIDSKVYKQTFYGILNAYGDFWTPLAFESQAKARQHIVDFWGANHKNRDQCLQTHKIVPVRIRLNAVEEPR